CGRLMKNHGKYWNPKATRIRAARQSRRRHQANAVYGSEKNAPQKIAGLPIVVIHCVPPVGYLAKNRTGRCIGSHHHAGDSHGCEGVTSPVAGSLLNHWRCLWYSAIAFWLSHHALRLQPKWWNQGRYVAM